MTAVVATATVWAVVAAGFTAVALVRLGRRTRDAPVAPPPPVLLLRPADGLSPQELHNLAVPIAYGAALEQVVLAPMRPPLPAHVGWLASDPTTANRKVGHLVHALARLPVADRIVLAIDADVAVDGTLIAALAAPVAAGAALATAAPLPLPARGLGPRAARALLARTHLDFVALDAMRIGARAVCGKAMGLGVAAQAMLSGLRDRIGEDLELAQWLHRSGARVELAAVRARVPQVDGTPTRPALARFARWMQVLRAHRPGLWLTVPLLFTPSLPLLVLALATRSPWLGLAVAALWGFRTVLSFRLAGARGVLDWPLGEALLLTAHLRSLCERTVAWRGRTFRVRRGGRMEPIVA